MPANFCNSSTSSGCTAGSTSSFRNRSHFALSSKAIGDRLVGAYGRVVFKSVDQLWELAAKLKAMHGVEAVEITGYTDSQGQAAFNQKLSEQRAEAVKKFLMGAGLSGARITSTTGRGAQPGAHDPARRVDVAVQ